jgi:hypothetical protein
MMCKQFDFTALLPENEVFKKTWDMHMKNRHKWEGIPVVEVREYCD